VHEPVEKTGTQGVELLMWLAMRGALVTGGGASVRKMTRNSSIPISNTATAVLALETV
jgi:protocatechuate 4,5-dioxygenase beta chain